MVANIDKTLNISLPVCTMVISQFGITGLSQGFWGANLFCGLVDQVVLNGKEYQACGVLCAKAFH